MPVLFTLSRFAFFMPMNVGGVSGGFVFGGLFVCAHFFVEKGKHLVTEVIVARVVGQLHPVSWPGQVDMQYVADSSCRAVGHHDDAV